MWEKGGGEMVLFQYINSANESKLSHTRPLMMDEREGMSH